VGGAGSHDTLSVLEVGSADSGIQVIHVKLVAPLLDGRLNKPR
jgi:hypothetical protein